MTIVCLGWGSLIWCQKALPVRGAWCTDGPDLPLEFARQSRDKRITLVICKGVPETRTLWAELDVKTRNDAKVVLAVREGVKHVNINSSIGFWSSADNSGGIGATAIGLWATAQNFEGVVWTALKPRIAGVYRTPSQKEVIDHLRSLQDLDRDRAEEYIRFAPQQIQTQYRPAIEKEFSWKPKGLT